MREVFFLIIRFLYGQNCDAICNQNGASDCLNLLQTRPDCVINNKPTTPVNITHPNEVTQAIATGDTSKLKKEANCAVACARQKETDCLELAKKAPQCVVPAASNPPAAVAAPMPIAIAVAPAST